MKVIGKLGIAGLAAVIASTIAGLSSASAESTALCKADTALVCPESEIYAGHIEGLAVEPELLSNLANVTCDHSVILGWALGGASAPDKESQLTHLESIAFTGDCLTGTGVGCTITTITLGLVDLLKLSTGTGSVLNLGATVRVVCAGVINCTLGGEVHGEALSATLPLNTTSSLGLIHVNNKPLASISGLLCPAAGHWDAEYKIQLPHEVFVAEGTGGVEPDPEPESTALCKADALLVCPEGEIYAGHIEGLAVKPQLLSNLGNVTCDHSVILGRALGGASAPDEESQLTHLESISFTGDCLTGGGVSCTVTTISLGLVDLLKTGPNEGLTTSLGSTVKVECPGVIKCTFGGELDGVAKGATLPLTTSGTPSLASVSFTNVPLKNISGLLCPAAGHWDAEYKIQLPHEVFVTEGMGGVEPKPAATAVCQVDTALVCPGDRIYTGHIEGLAVKPQLLSNLGNVTCDHSVILGSALDLAVAPAKQITHLELIDFTGDCLTGSGVGCTVTTVSLGLVDLLKTGPNAGLVTSLGSQVKVVCPGGINCTFGGEIDGTVKGATLPLTTSGTPSLAAVSFSNAALPSATGTLCPNERSWHAEYKIQLPHDAFLAE